MGSIDTLNGKVNSIGDRIAVSGIASVVTGAYIELCTISLSAGCTYLMLSSVEINAGASSSIIANYLNLKSGTTNFSNLGYTNRTTATAGGGCTNFGFINCKTNCEVVLRSYGYSGLPTSAKLNGLIVAIRMK